MSQEQIQIFEQIIVTETILFSCLFIQVEEHADQKTVIWIRLNS